MQTVCAPFVPQAAATHGKNLPAVVFQTAAERYSGQRFPRPLWGHRGFRFRTEGLVLSRGGNRSEHFRCYFAMGKIRGTLRMRSHISIHRATTKYFSNSFVFKNEIEKEGLPGDITPALGAGGPEFKSRRPDQNISRIFFRLMESA